MLFKHMYLGIRVPAVLEFFKVGDHCEVMLDVTEYFLLFFKGICMNFFNGLKKNIFTRSVSSKQPHKIVQRLTRHPLERTP